MATRFAVVLGIAAFLGLTVPAMAAIPASERSALLSIYNSTNGAGWWSKSGWLGPPGTECQWFAIECDSLGRYVEGIHLVGNNLSGTFPALAMANLQLLNVSGNQLSGPLPDLSGLPKLHGFFGSLNQFSGPIPAFGNLLELESYAVEINLLTGPLPSLAGLPKLGVFSASNTGLTGPIPSLAGLRYLQSFDVSWNQLSGPIPPLAGLTYLRAFNVHVNQLDGAIPPLAGLTNLATFNAYNNQLSGPIPELTGLAHLEQFRVGANPLTGPIPALTGLQNLHEFNVDGCALTGSIPSLAGLVNLWWFDVSANQLSGTIPPLTGLSSLAYFWAMQNRLEGEIPSLAGLNSLVSFQVGNNQLTGAIPSLSGLAQLSAFGAGDNQLEGSIPSLSGLTNLDYLELYGNRLTGQIPSFAGLTKLVYIVLDANRLTGSIPSLTAQHELDVLSLRDNALTGPFPDFGGSPLIRLVDIAQNKLSGPLPHLSALSKLEQFVAADNQASGPLPSISGLENLTAFSVSRNQLTGPLPPLAGLPALSSFSIDNNQLSGSVPDFTESPNIRMIRLGGNQLSGNLPPAPATLDPSYSSVCPNYVNHIAAPAWDVATGVTPWYSACPPFAQFLSLYPFNDVFYGSAPILARATSITASGSSSGIAIVFSASPPAVCSSTGANGETILLHTTGICTVTANQAGNADYSAAAPASRSFTIQPAPSTIRITGVTPSPSQPNAPFNVRFDVAGVLPYAVPDPAAMVTVRRGTDFLCEATVSTGSCMGTIDSVGTYSLSASFPGDDGLFGSQSLPYGHSVGLPPAVVTMNAIPGSIHLGMDSMVSVSVGGAGTPSGTVNVTGAGGSCLVTLAAGSGQCQLSPTAVGANQSVIGLYNGDATNAAANGVTTIVVKSALDVDDNGQTDALTDGLIIMRYLFGLTGTALVNGAVGTGALRTDPAAIEAYLSAIRPLLDVDGDGNPDALTDGLLIVRFLSGLRGPALIQDAFGLYTPRQSSIAVESYISGLIQ